MGRLFALLANVIPTTAAVYIVYLLGLVIYRLFFHPLAKFPGPKFATVSRWHEFFFDVVQQGQFTFVIEEWHKRYGPIVRIAPDELHIADSSFYDTMYTKAGRVDKYDWMMTRFGMETAAFSTVSADLHAIRRGALNPLFSRSRIIQLEGAVRDKVDLLRSRLHSYHESREPLRINRAFQALVGDVVMRYSFGIDYDHLSSKDFELGFHDTFMANSMQGALSLQFPIILRTLGCLPDKWVAFIEPKYGMIFQNKTDLLNQVITLKKERDPSSPTSPPNDVKAPVSSTSTNVTHSIFRTLIDDPSLPAREKEDIRLTEEAQIVIAAGIVTTGWALSVGAYHITANPEIYATLHAELKTVMPSPTSPLPPWTTLEKLPYLTGCVRESVRISYGVCGRNPRLFPRPLRYRDWTIPARTPVSMTLNDISNDEAIFPHHDEFRPERWLGSPRAPDGNSLDHYFVSFQKGSRGCLGINLALCELYLVTAAVYRYFRLELFDTTYDADVKLAHDFLIPSPRLDSKGIRVKCFAAES